eukprot:snap_masked-scaffold_13-processed-gene-10.36-mRNA-1 protein AED:1.00 eAED:1.00 QI:0/0/0/0/1/1/2/0/479
MSFLFDSDAAPLLYVLMMLLILVQRKDKSFKLGKRRKLLIVLAPVVLIHKYLQLLAHRNGLHLKLDKVFPDLNPETCKYFEHDSENLQFERMYDGDVTVSSVLSLVDSAVRKRLSKLYDLEKGLIYSFSKSFSHFYQSPPAVKDSTALYKSFTPVEPGSDLCSGSISFLQMFSLNSLYTSRKHLDLGKLHLDIYYPNGVVDKEAVDLVLVFTHGGSWRAGDKRVFQTNYVGGAPGYLLNPKHHGLNIAVVSIAYRLACTKATGLEMLDDVSDAVLYVKQYFSEDVKLMLFGTSAGAHLAMLTAFSPGMIKKGVVDGVVGMYGPYEIREGKLFDELVDRESNWLYREWNRLYVKIFNKATTTTLCKANSTLDELQNCKEMVSPVAMVENLEEKYRANFPKVLTVHGQKDPIVLVEHAHLLQRALDERNVSGVLLDIPCQSHDCDIMCSSACSQATVYGLHRFIQHLFASEADRAYSSQDN